MEANTVHNKFSSAKDKKIDVRIMEKCTHVSNEHSNNEKLVSGKHLPNEICIASYVRPATLSFLLYNIFRIPHLNLNHQKPIKWAHMICIFAYDTKVRK